MLKKTLVLKQTINPDVYDFIRQKIIMMIYN